MRRGCCVLIGVLALAACGGKKVNSAAEAARIAAETRAFAELRVSEGCYDCLLEAKGAYEKLGVTQGRPSVAMRLFEIELLLTLRERELAMDSAASLARARALAPELPADGPHRELPLHPEPGRPAQPARYLFVGRFDWHTNNLRRRSGPDDYYS